MSITPQFLDELRSRVPVSEVVGRFVSWDHRKSRPTQGDYWAPCPFHDEKTASFHADDRKGFFYCFGCHKKGDAITFLREKSNLDFVEAVREMANMAGMAMPDYDPKAKEKSDAHARLRDMHEYAARYYSLQLQSMAGANARDYLKKNRGLNIDTIEAFSIGLAPNARDALVAHLREKGFEDQEMVEAGLALKPDDGGGIFDRFRNRIMFPIIDTQGRVIAFGGRALDKNAKAKYLNSAETPIFHKGRVLYNLRNARNHLREEKHLVLVEGYMDVIALAQSGFKAAIAPLGTAVTMDQLEAVWRINGAPILAMDGDKAGYNAAIRIAHMVLPHISAEKRIYFMMMPDGQDPDDFVKKHGAKGFRDAMKEVVPLVDILWQDAMGEGKLDTPEARSAFDGRLKAFANKIEDGSLRSHYLAEFRERRQSLWQPKTDRTPSKSKPAKPKQNPYEHQDFRIALLLRTILLYPQTAKNFTDDLTNLSCPNRDLDKLRKEVIMAYGDENAIERLATKQNLDMLSFGCVMQNLRFFDDQGNMSRALDVASDDIARITVQSRAKDEIERILRELQSQDLTEEQDALVRNAVIMRDEARGIFDQKVTTDEDNRAYLRHTLSNIPAKGKG